MKYIFLGGMFDFPIDKKIEKNAIGKIDYAANKLQWKIIKGLVLNGLNEINLVSLPYAPTYPDNSKVYRFENYIYNDFELYGNKINFVSLGFNNLKYYRNISRYKTLRGYFNEMDLSDTIFFVYSLHSPFLKIAEELKNKYGESLHVCCIITDIPQFMEHKKNAIKRQLKKYDTSKIYSYLKSIDSFVILTKYMATKLEIDTKPHIVIEGMVEENIRLNNNIEKRNNKTIFLYSGSIDKEYGIFDLVDAFNSNRNMNIELKICGGGKDSEELKNYIINSSNIEYFGQVSPEQASNIQDSADILINPRKNIGEYTKYSFPSKNLEYLSKGKPVIAYKLDGIPEEYDEYLIYVKDNSINALSEAIKQVSLLEDSDLKKIGKRNFDFVKKYKNNKVLTKKIVNMINNNFKNKGK